MPESTIPEPVIPDPKPNQTAVEVPTSSVTSGRKSRSSRGKSLGESSMAGSKRTVTSSRSHRRSRSPFWQMPWLVVWRRANAAWAYWKPTRVFTSGLHGGVVIVDSMLKFEGSEFELERDDGRILIRTWPSTRTLCNPLWWISSAVMFARRWLVTRRYLPLLLAVPAATVALGLIGAISAGSVISVGTQSMVYKRILAAGITEIDLQLAQLAVDALIRLDPSNTDAIFDRALLEAKSGKADSAAFIMTELATIAKSPHAALWLANAVGDTSQFASWSRQQKITYHHWLQIAVANAPDNPVPRRMLGDVRALVGNKSGAYEALLPIADINVDTSYLVYFLQKDLGHTELAVARSEKLERAYKSRLQAEPQDITSRVQYALLLASLERFSEARELIEQDLKFSSTTADQLRLNNTTSELLVLESTRLAATDKTPRGLMERMSKLKQAAGADPTNAHVLEAITQICFEVAESKDNELQILRESLIQNIDPDTSHFILGTIALNEGHVAEATQHLELAAKNNPNMPGFLNNLAHALCYAENPDLERGLRIANAANELLPNHPYLSETRGQIYLKLKRYTEAIADLEVALNAPELHPQVRASLAVAYEALGQVEIARRQRELATQNQ